ncbi:MAG: phasin family protein [Gammaproteobacteria bacterium]|nr:phasin family protein [Gammaproteobacteria bacterium]MCP5424090.1 phasin family protein [Gammaproteobacteria bacterium]MCP5459485.1 phasin family protein [Gammaproteobacteria bacterium]
MYDAVLSKLFANPQALPNVLSNAGQLVLNNVEKLTALQMNALQSYVDLGLGQVRAAAKATDAKGLQDFYKLQADAANSVRQRLMDDAKAMADLGVDFKAGLDALVKDCVVSGAQVAA